MPRVGDIPPPEGPRRNQQTESRRAREARTDRPAEGSPSDRVEISGSARDVEQVAGRLNEEARRLPDVREERVEEIRAKLRSGAYDTEEVRRTVADRILDQLGL